MSLKYLRMQSGKSLAQVAAEVGVSKQRYCAIEKRDRITATSEFTARQIAKSLGVNLFAACDESVLKFKPQTEEEKALLVELVKGIEVA